jgi:hypothetical protein
MDDRSIGFKEQVVFTPPQASCQEKTIERFPFPIRWGE